MGSIPPSPNRPRCQDPDSEAQEENMMKHLRVRLRVWGVVGSLALLVAACGGDDPVALGDDPVPVVFGGSVTWYGHLPIMVAAENGYFEEEGLDFTYETILTSADRLTALTAGDVHFSNLGRTSLISAMAEGNESFYFFANIDDSPGEDGLYARAGIESIEDLAGKTVAANTSAEVAFFTHLEDHGMSVDDVDYVNLSPSDMCLALENGDVDAIDVWQPILDDCMEAVPDGKLLLLDTDSSIYEQFGTAAAPDIVIIQREIVDETPDVAKAITEAMFRGVDFVNESPDETAELVAEEYFRQPADEVLEGFSGFQFFGAENFEEHITAHTEQMQWLAQWLYDQGQISSVPEVSEWVEYDFVLEMLEENES
ncbi:MAG: ABC transporter substrate-binding protein [Acidimicrobiia bacterium]|nr:ABC transporter substrate-binding protein [Acidimicrobiia bacterium]